MPFETERIGAPGGIYCTTWGVQQSGFVEQGSTNRHRGRSDHAKTGNNSFLENFSSAYQAEQLEQVVPLLQSPTFSKEARAKPHVELCKGESATAYTKLDFTRSPDALPPVVKKEHGLRVVDDRSSML